MSEKHLKKGSEFPKNVEGKIRLYSMKYCAYAQRVRLILSVKKVPHEVININLKSKPEWFLEINPLGKVPTMEIESKFIPESLDICDYLDEKFPDPPLHSKNEEDRVIIKNFDNVISLYYKIRRTGDTVYLEEILTHVAKLDRELQKRGLYFGGNAPHMIDYLLWPWAERVPELKLFLGDIIPDTQTFPHLHSWCAAMRLQEAVEKTKTNIHNLHKISELYRTDAADIDYDI